MDEITVITPPLSYSQFYENHILKNKPCLFSECFTEDWLCRKEWVINETPNVSVLKERYGHLQAPVVDCSKKYFSSHEKCDMKVSEYFYYWENRGDKILYLKDWHLQRDHQGKNFYEVPFYFSSDWLNEYYDSQNTNDDYRFVYIGVQGSWTPFHADVFRSFSWSANICGLKKWYLYPPGKEEYLKDKYGKLTFDVTKKDIDLTIYPDWLKAGKPIEILQKSGEILFVPSGWYHQVVNVEDTLSVNHNWVNAGCFMNMFHFLRNELFLVKKEISDCEQMDGFHQQCQLILNASAGIDYPGIHNMILFLIKRRLNVTREYFHSDMTNVLQLLSRLHISSKPQIPHKQNIVDAHQEMKYVDIDMRKLKDVAELLMDDKDYQLVVPSLKISELRDTCILLEMYQTKPEYGKV